MEVGKDFVVAFTIDSAYKFGQVLNPGKRTKRLPLHINIEMLTVVGRQMVETYNQTTNQWVEQTHEHVGVRPCEEKDFRAAPTGWSAIDKNAGGSVFYCLNETESGAGLSV